jgi:hypothetical protein
MRWPVLNEGQGKGTVALPPASYLANADAAADSGVTADIQGVMIADARLRARRGWSRQAGTSSVPWAWRSLWQTPRWPTAATPGSSINPAHHPHGGASARTIGTVSER